MAQYQTQPAVDIYPLGPGGGQFQGMLYTSNLSGVIVVGSKLYYPAFNFQFPDAFLSVAQSSDYGKTWQILDAANQPSNAEGISVTLRNDGKTLTFFYAPLAGSPFQFLDFNTETNLWSTVPYGDVGGPVLAPTGGPSTVFARGDGQLSVLYLSGDPGNPITLSVYDPVLDSWSAPVDVCVNIEALPGYDPTETFLNNNWTTLFDGDNIYLFCHTDNFVDPPAWNFRCFFQLIQADNSTPVVNFYDFPNNNVDPPDIQTVNIKMGVPCMVRGNVYLPIARTDLANFPFGNVRMASSYWGTVVPGVSQTWTELTANGGATDPGYKLIPDPFDITNTCNTMGGAFFDGQKLYYVYTGQESVNVGFLGNDQIRLLTCIPFSDDPNDWIWTGQQVQSIFDEPFIELPNYQAGAYFFFVTLLVTGNYVLIASSVTIIGDTVSFWYGQFGPAPTVYFEPPPSVPLPFECCMDFHQGCALKV